MRELLTIGEVAKILKLSTSQIRFYEKKGLMAPHMIDENGYRLYSFKELDLLEGIAAFRKIDLSIAEIKEILHQDDDYDYSSLLDQTIESISHEMNLLNNTLKIVNQLKQKYEEFNNKRDRCQYYPKRILHVVDDDITINKSIKEFYEFVHEHNINYTEHDMLLYTITTSEINILCIDYSKEFKLLENLPKYELNEGMYYSQRIDIGGYDELDKALGDFTNTCEAKGYKLLGECVSIEDMSTFSFSKTRIYIILQVQVEKVNG